MAILGRISERQNRVMKGLAAVLFFFAFVVLGAKISYGATKPVYHLSGTFTAAGQGLISGSDVKIYGVNVGKVSTVKLVGGKAVIRLTINKKETIPVDAEATIRPKTLFGEKFVDIAPGPNEAKGPFLPNNGVIKKTQGGFEVEQVLTDLYPVLKEIKPEELGIILDTLARGGAGLGPNVNNAIHNLSIFTAGQAGNVAETQRFIDDLANLSDTLATHADEAVDLARDAHAALPEINARADEFTEVLKNSARLTGDLADVLENNTGLLNKLVPEGGKAITVLDALRHRLPATVIGLRQFFQTLAEAGTGVPYGDGGLAKIKLIVGSSCIHALQDCSGDLPTGYSGDPAKTQDARKPSLLGGLRTPSKGQNALRDLIAGLVG